jgi:hypothetical protein
MDTITLDATTSPPTVAPPGSARAIGDAGSDSGVIRYWYRCTRCWSQLEVAIDDIEHHNCERTHDSSE